MAISRRENKDRGTGIDTLVDDTGNNKVSSVLLNYAGSVYAVNNNTLAAPVPVEEFLSYADVSNAMAAQVRAYSKELESKAKGWAQRVPFSGSELSRG